MKEGQRIEHNRFGYGNIVELSGNPADLKAKIRFDDHGEKILILKYAKIRAVDVAK
jgi:DNA helicase-2/ATP-dependent DNA helicase PcrA